MKRPLAGLAIAFSLGIFIANYIKISFLLIYCLGIIALFLSCLSSKREARFTLFLLCLAFCLGAASFKNAGSLPPCHISQYIYKIRQPCVIRGVVDSQPRLTRRGAAFAFKANAIESARLTYSCCGNILVYLRADKNFQYGEELILRGNLSRQFAKRGARFTFSVGSTADIIRLNRNKGFKLKRFALCLKNKMEEIFFRQTSLITAAILDAMILGEKKHIPALLYKSMIKSGTVHILVVSGFNVGIVTFIVVLFLKLLRLPRKLRCCLAVPLIILYCLVTGASVPVVRATIMAVIFSLAYLLKREADIYNSLSAAAIIILGINPNQLFDIGFQLSFASVIAIVYFYPKIKAFLRIDSLEMKWIRFFIDSALVSFSAWLGTFGLVAYYFRLFSPITVFANLFIVPLASLITLSGFSLIFVSLTCPGCAKFFALSNELLAAALLQANSLLIKLPAAYFYLPPRIY